MAVLRVGRDRPPFAVAMGGGGAFGIAFHLGIAAGLAEQGVRVEDQPMLGLSAGTWAAASLVTATPLDEIVDSWRWGAARRAADGLFPVAAATERLYGDARDARVSGAALTLPGARRVILDGSRYRLCDIVAASSAPPRRAVPVVLEGRRLYDAGLLFNTSADRAARAEALLVLAPLARGALGWQGRAVWERRLVAELAGWRLRNRRPVVVVRPDPEVVAAGGETWSDVLGIHVARSTYAAALEQGRRIAAHVAERLAFVPA